MLPGKYRCFSRLWQQGLNFTSLPILSSCTYSQSYCPEAPNARVKYVAHRASCCSKREKSTKFCTKMHIEVENLNSLTCKNRHQNYFRRFWFLVQFFVKVFNLQVIQGVPKNLLESREQYIVVSSLSFVFPGCLTRLLIYGARIFLFKSTINWQVDVQ